MEEKKRGGTQQHYHFKQCGESNSALKSHRPQELVAINISPLLTWHPLLFKTPPNHFTQSPLHTLSLLPPVTPFPSKQRTLHRTQQSKTLQQLLYMIIYLYLISSILSFFKKEKESKPK